MPEFLVERENAHLEVTHFIYTKDMASRKQKMMELANVYLAFPGGPGTLEEITEVISLGRLGIHHHPCVIYNVNHYFDDLAKQFDKMVTEGFLTQADRERVLFSQNLTEIAAFIEAF